MIFAKSTRPSCPDHPSHLRTFPLAPMLQTLRHVLVSRETVVSEELDISSGDIASLPLGGPQPAVVPRLDGAGRKVGNHYRYYVVVAIWLVLLLRWDCSLLHFRRR